jgi:hypothetical protein
MHANIEEVATYALTGKKVMGKLNHSNLSLTFQACHVICILFKLPMKTG